MTTTTRHRQRHREDREQALEALGLEIGDPVWYWYRHQDHEPRWVAGTVAGAGGKDGRPVIDVELTGPTLPEHYRGFVKWGHGWAVRPWSEQPPRGAATESRE